MKSLVKKKTLSQRTLKKRTTLKRKVTRKSVWKLLSQWVRLRDCLATTGTLTEGICWTCHKRQPFTSLQGGHLIDGHTGKNYLDERGIFIQCIGCNVFKHGNKEVFIPWFIKTYGQDLYDQLLQEKEAYKWTQDELEGLKKSLEDKITYIKNL